MTEVLHYRNLLGKNNATDKWHGLSIRKILENSHYTGISRQCREYKPSVTSKKRSNELSEHVIIENSHEIIIPLNGFFCFKNLSVAEKEKDKLNLEISLAYGVITKAEYQMAIVLTDTPRLFSTKNRHISGSDTLAPKSDE